MDTTTVLTIIKMIDTWKEVWKKEYEAHQVDTDRLDGAEHALGLLQDELQSFIEAELNKAEQ